MKRFSITYIDSYGSETIDIAYYKNIERAKEDNKHLKNVVIEEYTDLTHHKYIQDILAQADEIFVDNENRTVCKIANGKFEVRFYFDNNDNTWYDYCEYSIYSMGFYELTPMAFFLKYLCGKY